MLLPDWLFYLYLVYAGCYVLIFILFDFYWKKARSLKVLADNKSSVSLLIPVRNEEKQLPELIASLEKLKYPHLQIIFTNDFSEDKSVALLEAASASARARGLDWQLLHSAKPGKKAAQTTALLAATGEIIVSTDADCSYHPDWINQLVAPFSDPKILLVAGPVMTLPVKSPFFSGFQQIEWSSILLVTQLAFGMGNPIMCSGANMAYRRKTFFELKGYDGNSHLLSGDDEFLLKKILRTYGPAATTYVNQQEVLVKTAAQSSWADLFSQRARWASKWTAHKSIGHIVAALVPFVMQLLFLLSPILLFDGLMGIVVFFVLWSCKIGIEKWVVGNLLSRYSIPTPFLIFAVSSIIHPIYILITGLGVVTLDWEWKGRKQVF